MNGNSGHAMTMDGNLFSICSENRDMSFDLSYRELGRMAYVSVSSAGPASPEGCPYRLGLLHSFWGILILIADKQEPNHRR